jgi:hypothetical protein
MVWVVNAKPQPLYSQERPGTHCIGGWVGLRAVLDRCRKSRPTPGFDPRLVQPVAIRYTDYAIPAYILRKYTHQIMDQKCVISGISLQ